MLTRTSARGSGQKPRTKAFIEAIEYEDKAMEDVLGLKRSSPSEVIFGFPKDHADLHAVTITFGCYSAFTSGVKCGALILYGRRRRRSLLWTPRQSKNAAKAKVNL